MKPRMSEAAVMLLLMNTTACFIIAALWITSGWPAALFGVMLMFIGLVTAYLMDDESAEHSD